MAVSLPQDVILFQILTRVPINSVIRFKCVSKQWNSFLISDRFKEMHNRNHLKDHHLTDQKIFFFSNPAATFFTIDCESLPNKAPCVRYLPKFEASDREYMCMLTSFHGLVCLGVTKNNPGYSDFILWNPLTNEYKRLSKPSNPDHMECYKCPGRGYGLYYSSCEDDYKLLVLTESGNVYIYSLKSDSWRKLNKKAPEKVRGWHWRPGFCLSKNIYFHYYNITPGLVRFDTTAERFHNIETPPEYDFTNKAQVATTTVHRGSVHVCVKYRIRRTGVLNSTCLELWKLNADGDILSKVVTYQLMPNNDIRFLYPLNLMSNGNWLMRDHLDGGRICQVDLKKMNHTTDKEDHKSIGKNKREGNCHDEYDLYLSGVKAGYSVPVRYTETFVSPNQYKK